MKKLSDGNFTYPAGTCGVSKQSGASDLLEAYATQRDKLFYSIEHLHLPLQNNIALCKV
jgi:hypothetical protein